ncbi:MAG TPA: DUF6585 family protein [Streptosporangiaceae bacterium]|nr:DUF6585 family protein [Streptosporangiaceae bacterium]
MSTVGETSRDRAEFQWQVQPHSPVVSVFPWGFGWTAGCEWDKPPWDKWDKWPFKGIDEWHKFGDGAKKRFDSNGIFAVTQYVYTGRADGEFVGFADGSARWQDVTTIWHRLVGGPKPKDNPAPVGNQYVYTVVLADGRSVNFSGFRHAFRNWKLETRDLQPVLGTTTRIQIEQLGRLLEQAVLRTQLPKAIELIQAGQTVTFGPLSVSQRGITVRDRSLTWSQVKDARIPAGASLVHVKKAGRPLPMLEYVELVPNYFLFVALVRTVRVQRG